MKKTYFSGLARFLTLAGGSSILLGQSAIAQYGSAYTATGYPVPSMGALPMPNAGSNMQPQAQGGWNAGPSPYQLVANQQAHAGDHVHVPVPQPVQQNIPTPLYDATPMQSQPMATPSAGCNTCAPNMGTINQYAVDPGYTASCGGPACGAPNYGVPSYGPQDGLGQRWNMGGRGTGMWFGGANALIFNQQDSRYVRLTSDSNANVDPVLSTASSRIGTAGGVELFAGRYFNCGRNAIVGSYWGLFPDEQSTVVYPSAGGNLRSDLPFTVLGPGGAPATLHGIGMPAQNVYDWYDGAAAHRIVRDNEIQNIEINILGFGLGGAALTPGMGGGGGLGGGRFGSGGGSCGAGGYGSCGSGGCGSSCGGPSYGSCAPCNTCMGGPGSSLIPASCGRLRLSWLAGVRWFRFRDELEYASSETDTVFTTGNDDFYYRSDVTNDLVGFQLGSMATYCLSQKINLYAGTKFGVFGNHMQYGTYAGTATQAAAIISNNSYNGRLFDYTSSRTDIAFLGEANAGLAMRLTRCWSANVGYRAVAASGIATSVGNIPYDFSRPDDFLRINNSDSLILHGLVAGASYNF